MIINLSHSGCRLGVLYTYNKRARLNKVITQLSIL